MGWNISYTLQAEAGDSSLATTFNVTSVTGGTVPFAFGHVFAAGDVVSGDVALGDSLAWQCSPLTYWPDGSLRHAIIAGRVVTTANVAKVINLTGGAAPGGAALTETDLDNALPTVTITAGAFSWTLNDSVNTADRHRTVCAGPVMSNFIYRKSVSGNNHLVLWADCRVYSDGNVEIFPWVENAYFLVASPTADTRTYTVVIGGVTKFNQSIAVAHHTRPALLDATAPVSFSYWTGTDPQLTPAHNGAYLRASKMVPNYAYLSPSAGTLNGLQQTYTPNTLAGIDSSMGNAGTSAATLNQACALYVTSNDARAWKAAQVFDLSGGSWSCHHRYEGTNEPFSFTSYPSASLQVQDTPTVPEGTGTTNGTHVVSHQPSYGYLSWLCSGRWFFLDEMLLWAGWNYLFNTVSNRAGATGTGASGIIKTTAGANTDRGAAWALRTLAQSLVALPSTHPLYTAMKTSWEANTDWYATDNSGVNGGIGVNSLGVQGFYGDFSVSLYTDASNSGTYGYYAGWMQEMFHGVMGFTWDLDLPQSATSEGHHQTVRDHGYTMPVALAGDGAGNNWSYRNFTTYSLNWGTIGGSYYANWTSGAYANYKTGFSLTLPGGTTLFQHSSTTALTSADSSGPYFGQALTALAYAVDHGKTGATAAWDRVSQASNFSSVATGIFHNDPVYGLMPRTRPYILPAPGASLALTVNGGNTAESIRPSPFTTTQFNYSLYNSYGSGVFNPHYSVGGAFCIGPSGGHAHPDFTGVIACDFTDGLWKLHEHNNGGTRYGGNLPDMGYQESQSTGSPYYEITGSGQTPAPPHPYQNNVVLTPAQGGSALGDILLCGRGAMFIGGIVHSGSMHRFNLVTNTWSRLNDTIISGVSYETAAVPDPARGRIWILHRAAGNDQFVPYLRTSDWTMQSVSIGAFVPGVIGDAGRGWMYAGFVFLQCTDNTLRAFDPDNPTNNWTTITITGGTMPSNRNKFVWHPTKGKFYWIDQTGGTTLVTLTPPASNPLTNTWTLGTTTITPSIPRQTQDGDGSDSADHNGALIYVPYIDMLAWFPGGSTLVQLINPS